MDGKINFYEANNDEALASGSAIPRGDLLRRTPPRARTHSLPEQMGKRKILEQIENLTLNQTQCESCKAKQHKRRRKILTKDDSYDCFKLATEEDWRDGILPKIVTQQGNFWEVAGEYTWILPSCKDLKTSYKSVAGVIDRLGKKRDLLKQNKKKGEVAMMVHSVGFPEEGGNLTHKTKLILYPITDGGVNEEAEDENIFKALSIVELTMLKHGKKKLAIPEMEGVTGLIVCEVLEFLFVNTDIEILLMKNRPQQHPGKQQASSRTVNSINQVKPKQDAYCRHCTVL
ncbi:hypothetical protein JTB14_035451 [Gonioctena quinquepunctata]|nr:hypothetical protein JTB14_035451 [Gonioctena quinquepunctata]